MTPITCIISLVLLYNPIGEYVDTKPVTCTILEHGQICDDIEKGYHYIKVDCSEGMSAYDTVKHPSNKKIRWIPNTDCYNLGDKL